MLSRNTVSAQAWVTYPSAPIETVLLTIQNQTADVYVGGSYSTDGIDAIQVGEIAGQLLLSINF